MHTGSIFFDKKYDLQKVSYINKTSFTLTNNKQAGNLQLNLMLQQFI